MPDAGLTVLLKPLPGKTDGNESQEMMKILVDYEGSDFEVLRIDLRNFSKLGLFRRNIQIRKIYNHM